MATTPEKSAELLNATAELTIAGQKVRLEMPVPAGPTRLAELLPLFRSMTDAFVAVSVENARTEGLAVSCRKGCGACCRQLVPIAEIEARRLREVVEAMPEPRRSTIRARFDAARQRLAQAGLLEKLREPRQFRDEDVIPFGMDYFQQGIACPFLEEESCSIYAERPLACREYLVVTPAAHCAAPTVESVSCVKLVLRTARTVRGLNAEHSEYGAPWVALILALEWADAHPDGSSPQPGPAWVREAFGRLTGHTVPEAAPET